MILLGFMAVLSGCVTIPHHGTRGGYTRALVGVELTVVNNYAECLDIEVSDGQHIECLELGHSEIIGVNQALGGPNEVFVIAKGRIRGTDYIGTATYRTKIQRGRTTARVWTVDNLKPPRRVRLGR